ncbi:heavy metal translocating P-type ATPase [Novosphingobium nitrogenifigens DSM 19370]|uniref:Heavy metal translocating P-type ATPase n=1 Tax=Novosphingobium nitrogenifigens DSM 19370 TaxID=983920 RepID=F1Z8A9_9SPHN|nr:heavy metal translocating P-type ATPase [Novosphingobium nitrogenifigens]EGD59116.1 heavy metal translocating P-type ATPase [Novosphingobium nitrogenifigens DSM 19370]
MASVAQGTDGTGGDLAHSMLAVPAMHCAACISKVEGALCKLDGVESARVNLTARQVEVVHGPSVSVPDFIAALALVGYEAQPRYQGEEVASAVKPLLGPLAVAAFACMNVMLLSVSVWSGADGSTRTLFHWLSAGIGVPAILYSGRPFFSSAVRALRHFTTNMDVPISIGVLLATCLSFYETVTGGAEAWFDGTLMLLLFLLAGRALDAMMRDRARAGVDALLRQAPGGAMIVASDGTTGWVASDGLRPGMVMRVAAGERLAADGVIVAGRSRFDQSLLTGESAPVHLGAHMVPDEIAGDDMVGSVSPAAAFVLAGTLNLENPVDVRATATGTNTALAEIARLMEAAGQGRSTYVRIADRASRLYAPVVHTLAGLSFAGWMLAGAGIYKSLVIAISVLIITCPCALGLAVPVAQVVAAGALLKRGILVKDGSALERLADVNRALLDKTGTLTMGRPVPDPASIAAFDDETAAVALGLASHSRHPLSLGLARALAARGVHAADLTDVVEVSGRGLEGRWNGVPVSLGRPRGGEGMATALSIGNAPVRLVRFADRLRPDYRQALDGLQAMGIECSILSGDSIGAVAEVARETGLTAQGAALPADKQEAITRLQGAGQRVLMVGDGLNDGPALAAANASIAPGTASDVGLQAADFVFTGDSLLALPRAVAVARSTMRVVRQNFVMAIGYNLLAVPLAVAGLVTPLFAAAAMSTSSLLVIGNSLRLARGPRDRAQKGKAA